jgi:hypothetical protein
LSDLLALRELTPTLAVQVKYMDVMNQNKALRQQIAEMEASSTAARKEGGAADAASGRLQKLMVDMDKLRRQLKTTSDAQCVLLVPRVPCG